MHTNYSDIIDRIAEPPLWFDENAVPRYVPFHPHHTANIHAREIVLADFACQGCGRTFRGAVSEMNAYQWPKSGTRNEKRPTLAEMIGTRDLEYGDPPDVGCCGAGPTMNSIPHKVLEYWRRDASGLQFQRDPALEIDISPDWAR